MALTIGTAPISGQPAGCFDVAPPDRPLLFWEPFPKRLRVVAGGETIADSRKVIALHETGKMMRLCVPRFDVRRELMTAGTTASIGPLRAWSVGPASPSRGRSTRRPKPRPRSRTTSSSTLRRLTPGTWRTISATRIRAIEVDVHRIANAVLQLTGNDETALAFNAMGGVGCISVTANVAPRLCAELQGGVPRRRLCRGAPVPGPPLPAPRSPVHRRLAWPGQVCAQPCPARVSEALRLPMTRPSETSRAAVNVALTDAGLV